MLILGPSWWRIRSRTGPWSTPTWGARRSTRQAGWSRALPPPIRYPLSQIPPRVYMGSGVVPFQVPRRDMKFRFLSRGRPRAEVSHAPQELSPPQAAPPCPWLPCCRGVPRRGTGAQQGPVRGLRPASPRSALRGCSVLSFLLLGSPSPGSFSLCAWWFYWSRSSGNFWEDQCQIF